jgi:DNA-directed RNA polymerase subunit H (RpoH/RPB5)
MQPGDLVRITRASIAVPKDSIGLIVKARVHDDDLGRAHRDDPVYTLYHVQLVTDTKLNGTVRRYLPQDLRKIR